MKQLFDIVFALVMLILFSPAFIIICILIALNMGRPVLFRQLRIGKNCKEFSIYKFRTMSRRTNGEGRLLPDNQRLTGLGRFLRRTSLDEVPQLFNILKGEMSFVGPRPLLVEYLPFYSPAQIRRHDVLPGITGWAQVNGRNALSWKQKFEYDLYYIKNASFCFDMKILWLSILKVMKREGIDQDQETTMELFNGKN